MIYSPSSTDVLAEISTAPDPDPEYSRAEVLVTTTFTVKRSQKL